MVCSQRLLSAPTAILLSALLLVSGCAKDNGDGESSQPVATGPVNQVLDIALTGMPTGLMVATNEGDELVLVPDDPQRQGSLAFSVGPVTRGINLVAAVDQHRARIEHLPEGKYLGRTELGGQAGVAFLSRGRYQEDGADIEQLCLFVIHPNGSRRLDLSYTYPADEDSSERAQQLLEVFNEVELPAQQAL